MLLFFLLIYFFPHALQNIVALLGRMLGPGARQPSPAFCPPRLCFEGKNPGTDKEVSTAPCAFVCIGSPVFLK